MGDNKYWVKLRDENARLKDIIDRLHELYPKYDEHNESKMVMRAIIDGILTDDEKRLLKEYNYW